MAAQRFAPGERLLTLRAAEGIDAYEVHTLPAREGARVAVLADLPPRNHVDLLPQLHGEVRISMLVEKLLRTLRNRRRDPPPRGNDARP